MVKWCGDTSQVTTHNELYIINQAYLFPSSNGRPPKPLNVQFAQILGGKIGSQKLPLFGYKRELKIQHQIKVKPSQTLPKILLSKPSINHQKPSANFHQTEEKNSCLCLILCYRV